MRRLPNLQRLDLEKTFVTDSGLAHLVGASKLQFLNLRGVNWTAESLRPVRVTDDGIRDLKEALPNLKVQ